MNLSVSREMKQSKFWSQQSAVCTVCTICMVCTVVRLLRSPTWSNFRWLGPFGFPCNTSPLMLFYATLSNFRLPARCSVDLCPTLKKADLENIVYVLLEKPKDSWCCSCVNNFLCVFPSLCFSFFVFFLWFMRAIEWANVADSGRIYTRDELSVRDESSVSDG